MKIDIYTGPMCPYCDKAKDLFSHKDLDIMNCILAMILSYGGNA